MTHEETIAIVRKIHDIYSTQDRFIDTKSIEARINYWEIYFKDFTFAVVNRVVDEWIKSHRDMPMPSDLLQSCKDYRDLYAYPKGDPMNWKSTAEQIWEARHGVITEDHVFPKHITDMTDKMIEILRTDPAVRKQYEESHPESAIISDLGDGLPYEI